MSTIPLAIVLGENKYSIDNINLNPNVCLFTNSWLLFMFKVLRLLFTLTMSAHHVPLKSSSGEEVFTTHGTSDEGTRSKEGFKCRCRCKESTVRSDKSNKLTYWLGARWTCGKCAPLVQGMRRCSRAGRALRQQKAPCETNFFRFNTKMQSG